MGKSNDCKNCSGIGNCSRYCELRAGENIVKFINGVDTAETEIGEYRKLGGYGPDRRKTYFVSGYRLDRGNREHTTMMLPVQERGISMKPKLNSCFGLAATVLFKRYAESTKLPKYVVDNGIEVVKKFNSNRVVTIPIKTGADILISHLGFDGKIKKTLTNVEALIWAYDVESTEIVGKIMGNIDKNEEGSEFEFIRFSDYNIKWFLPNLEKNLRSSEINRDIIRMTNWGLIRPIEFEDKKILLAVDSQHVYMKKDDSLYIIGSWGESGITWESEYLTSIVRSPAYVALSKYLKYIEKHKRFIIPYGFDQPVSVKV